MVKIISQFLPILCVCLIEVCSNEWDPRVWPDTFVDDGKPFVEFSCGAYLKRKEWLSWYKGSNKKIFTTVQQQYDGYRTIELVWPLADLKDEKVYCVKENETWNGGTSWKQTLSKIIPITLERKIELPTNKWGPLLTPATSVDAEKRVIESTCYSFLGRWNTLSCFHIKDKNVSLLGMVQQETNYGYKKVTCRKTLEPSDNGTNIYCLEKESGRKEYTSNYIPITFERQIEALEPPYVTVEPSADVVFFDEGEELEFVCGGSAPLDGRRFTWYLQSPDLYQVVPLDQVFFKSTNQTRMTLPMQVFHHKKLVYCVQEFAFQLSRGTVTRDGELARSRTITLLHRSQCNRRDRPRVTPERIVDESKTFIQFTCYAFLETGQLLSWYQSKGSNKSDSSLLRMIQLQEPRSSEGDWMVLTLNKTLEQSDNGSELYCAQQSVLRNGSFSEVINQTERIPLTFNRNIPAVEEPFIRVDPNDTAIFFGANRTLRLACGGSVPAPGRNYTWYRKDLESSLTVPADQTYDARTNLNILELHPDESYHLNELYCAQGSLSYIRLANGSLRLKSYGTLLVSNKTTLIQREIDGNALALSAAIPLGLLVLAVASASCWALRRRRAARPAPAAPAPAAVDSDDIYGEYVNVSRGMAPPQVTYAVLDLQKNSSTEARAPPSPETSLYAEIARNYELYLIDSTRRKKCNKFYFLVPNLHYVTSVQAPDGQGSPQWSCAAPGAAPAPPSEPSLYAQIAGV